MEKEIIDTGDLIITFEKEGHIHFHFKKTDEAIKFSVVENALAIIKNHSIQKACLLVTTEEGATLTQEARDYASSKEFDELIYADAIVRTNYSHEMAANFFIRFNRPNRPVKLFPNMKKAMVWITEKQEEIKNNN